jgi:microcystin-dependent protein
MIPHRFARLVGAVLLLAPSLALAQSSLQQPCTDRTKGCTVDAVPSAAAKLYANDLYLQGLIGTRFGQLGNAAFLNVGTVGGTVADGGALAAETARALAAEAQLAPLVSPTFAGTPRVPTAAPGTTGTQAASLDFVAAAVGAGGGGGGSPYAVLFTAQSLTSGQQLQARQNIAAVASGDSHVLGNGSTATTQAAGDNTTKVATDAFVTGALSSYAGTVSATYAPLASPALTGTPTAPTAAAGTSTAQLATTGFVAASYAPLASPALTGSPTVPTQPAGDNSTKAASTAYADRAVAAVPAMPSGAVSYFAMSTCPATWVKANGAALSRTANSSLFAAIGTTFGAGDGSTTFNPPDMRGYFARGFDDGRGIDSGRTFGSAQADQNLAHGHGSIGSYLQAGGGTYWVPNDSSQSYLPMQNVTQSVASSGGNEARPKNIALLACIKL